MVSLLERHEVPHLIFSPLMNVRPLIRYAYRGLVNRVLLQYLARLYRLDPLFVRTLLSHDHVLETKAKKTSLSSRRPKTEVEPKMAHEAISSVLAASAMIGVCGGTSSMALFRRMPVAEADWVAQPGLIYLVTSAPKYDFIVLSICISFFTPPPP